MGGGGGGGSVKRPLVSGKEIRKQQCPFTVLFVQCGCDWSFLSSSSVIGCPVCGHSFASTGTRVSQNNNNQGATIRCRPGSSLLILMQVLGVRFIDCTNPSLSNRHRLLHKSNAPQILDLVGIDPGVIRCQSSTRPAHRTGGVRSVRGQ